MGMLITQSVLINLSGFLFPVISLSGYEAVSLKERSQMDALLVSCITKLYGTLD